MNWIANTKIMRDGQVTVGRGLTPVKLSVLIVSQM